MTNKEAGEQLENLRAYCSNMLRHTFTDGEDRWGKDLEALDLAIKALDQEPCEDAISRQAVDTSIDELAIAISDERCYLPQRGRDTGAIMQNILDLPPVTPQPKTGHCKDCKYFEYDSVAKVDGIPLIVAHEICSRWGNGCKTREGGYCFLFKPQESEVEE